MVISILILVLIGKINLNSVKAGIVEVNFEKKVKDLGVYNTIEFRNLKNLNEHQLKLFLIMGGNESKFYIFTNSALRSDAVVEEYTQLQTDSLLTFKVIGKKHDSTIVGNTIVGAKLHKALIQSIYSQIIK